MNGRSFLDIAREQIQGTTSAHWRTAAGRAYYALMLEVREALKRWGFVPAPRDSVHTFVRLRCLYAADTDLKYIGRTLGLLAQLRNQADYDLNVTDFDSPSRAQDAIDWVSHALVLLDAILADPARIAAIIADIRARWP
jgi:hypothetical protein